MCKNRQMSLNQGLKLNSDVIEKVSWGIDMCTGVSLLDLLPKDMPMAVKSQFVEMKLVYACQQQGENGFDIREALRFIIDIKDHPRFNESDRDLAKRLLRAINNCRKKNEEHFKVHSKGLGIFCKRPDGIKANTMIVEYFGEIYLPWLWYEKQDVLKDGQNKNALSKELPDFYNIQLERHFNDEKGFDILVSPFRLSF